MNARIGFILVISLWLVQTATATDLQKKDFAYGYTIEIDGAGAVYSVPLPYEVYRHSVWDNLADVRVFNAEGEIVPHELRHAEPLDHRQEVRLSIPFFPLSPKSFSPDEETSLEVRRNIGGEVVSITKKGDVQQPASSYLLDLRRAGPYPLRLRLQWRTGGTGFVTPVSISASDNLLDWRRVGSSTLADLHFMGNRIRHRHIVLGDNPGKYLRLTLEKGGEAIRLTGIEAVSDSPARGMKRSWVDLPLRQTSEQGEAYLRAQLAGTLPVEALQLGFPQPNSLLRVRIETRIPGEPWRYLGDYLFYELLEGGVRLVNEPLVIARENMRSFRMEVLRDGTGGQSEPPVLEVGYLPHDLLFIVRGPGPFMLAFGNGELKEGGPGENRGNLHGLAGEQNRSIVRQAALGEKRVLGGEDRLKRKEEIPWKKIVLWAVLLSGVAVLAVMTWSLVYKKASR